MAWYAVRSFGLSDVGLVRESNEDVWAELPELAFYLLADGIGGHQAGEIAAKEAVGELCRLVKKAFLHKRAKKAKTLLEAHREILAAIQDVNQLIYRMGTSEKHLKGMGTTLCCLLVHQQGLIYGHVGDSRIYRFRHERLELLTRDHSLLSDLLEKGKIREGDIERVSYKNIITKAIGTEVVVEPSVHLTDVQDNDIYLLCSDGLSDIVPNHEMEQTLLDLPDLKQAGVHLVELAKAKGGYDNITVLLVKTHQEHFVCSEETHLSR